MQSFVMNSCDSQIGVLFYMNFNLVMLVNLYYFCFIISELSSRENDFRYNMNVIDAGSAVGGL